jgi:hypothetical protein
MRTSTKTTRSKKTKITIETERVWVIDRPGSQKAWCPACSKLVTAVTPDEVASLATRTHGSHCPVKVDKLHFIGTADSTLLVCADSLLKQA